MKKYSNKLDFYLLEVSKLGVKTDTRSAGKKGKRHLIFRIIGVSYW
jgi:hypothetical protein